MIQVFIQPTFESFREKARKLIANRIAPNEVLWSDAGESQGSLLPDEFIPAAAEIQINVPMRYLELARLVSAHRDPERWKLLYSALWRIQHGERHLLAVHVDGDVLRLDRMRQEIARDVHHMHAFVRFRRAEIEGEEWFVAWYKPDHHILPLAAPFFRERFAAMRWSIFTPEQSAHWDGKALRYGKGVASPSSLQDSQVERLWSAYYGSTFNPARMNLDLMRQEMPSRFWSQMPELKQLCNVLADAPKRLEKMRRQQAISARELVPQSRDLLVLRDAAQHCNACSLHCTATQTVFGEGPSNARIVLIGEQPGDIEDLKGRPFVGPAGDVLARAMEDAGISREQVYMTNAVKHFKFTREGKRRLHQTPRNTEVVACKPWLEAELEAIRPEVIVLLGATAAKALLGSAVRITRDAGTVQKSRYAEHTLITVHPSFVLRSGDEKQSHEIFARLVRDLTTAFSLAKPCSEVIK